jgi:hypothetical protein
MVVGLDEGDREVRMSISISLASEEGASLAVVEGKFLGIEVGDQEPCHQSAQAQIIGYVGSNATGRIFEWLGHDIMSRVTPLM